MALLVPASGFSQTAQPPTKGRVLLLKNERIFEGDIERVGEQYRIRRSSGGETWVPANTARRLCGSREETYEYLRKQANLEDPDERVRLAKWCLLYELRQQALSEAKAAAQLRPQDAEARRLLTHLERAAAAPAPPRPAAKPAPKPDNRNTQAVASGLELNAQCMGLFARRVQPILVNTCARCHASGKAGEFKLAQVFGDAPLAGKSSQQNLTAVLSQIRPEQPLNSPLLRMATSAHGGSAQPPLRNRETAAYKMLEQWVQLTAAHAPKAVAPLGDAPTPAERNSRNVFESVETKQAKDEKSGVVAASAKPKEEFAAGHAEKRDKPADEFDPLIFNRQMHPEKK